MDLASFAATDIRAGRPKAPCRICVLPTEVLKQVDAAKDKYSKKTIERWLRSVEHPVPYPVIVKHFIEDHA